MPSLRLPQTRAEAQRRADRILACREELAEAESENGIRLDPNTRMRLNAYHDALLARLADRFDVDVSGAARRASLAIRTAALVGALSITASGVLFFVRVWGVLSTPTQIALLVLAPIVALAATEASSRHRSWRLATPLLAVAAFGAFALDVEGLGRIFGLVPTPEALLAYGLFASGLAYAYDHRLLLAASAMCLVAWIMASLVRLSGAWWTNALARPESAIVAGAALAVWAQAPQRSRDRFPPILRAMSAATILLAVFALGREGALSWIPASPPAIGIAYQILAFPLAAVVVLVGLRAGFHEVFVTGTLGLLLFLFTKLVDWWWTWMPRYLFFLLVGALAIAVLWILARMRRRIVRP